MAGKGGCRWILGKGAVRQPERETRGLSFCRINLRELEDNRITGKRLEIILLCCSSYLTMFVSSAKLLNVDAERRRRSISSPRGQHRPDPHTQVLQCHSTVKPARFMPWYEIISLFSLWFPSTEKQNRSVNLAYKLDKFGTFVQS